MSLSNSMWTTRKSRINTSERLKSNDFISQVLLTYYSLFIIILTIVDMQDDNISFEVLTLVLSILILVVSTFIFSMNYKERSLRLQSAYIKINKLYRITEAKEKIGADTSEEERHFDDILECTENHSYCDYIQVMFEVKDNDTYKAVNPPFGYAAWAGYLLCKTKKYFFVSILFLIPIVILYCYPVQNTLSHI